jgi:hypothetical protein
MLTPPPGNALTREPASKNEFSLKKKHHYEVKDAVDAAIVTILY